MAKRIISILALLCLVIGLLPMAVLAAPTTEGDSQQIVVSEQDTEQEELGTEETPAPTEPEKAESAEGLTSPVHPSEDNTMEVTYLDRTWDGGKIVEESKTVTAIVVKSEFTYSVELYGGFYVVPNDVTIRFRLIIQGTPDNPTRLILMDGATLTAGLNVRVNEGNSLVIYGQTNDSGTLNSKADHEEPGIGGIDYCKCGMITICGGTVKATGGDYGADIGGAVGGDGGTITINGGKVTAKGGDDGAGIGSGYCGNNDSITINGGTVIATGSYRSAGIGGAYNGIGGTVTINGGNVTATGGEGADAVGADYKTGNFGTLTIANNLCVLGGDNKNNAAPVSERYYGPTDYRKHYFSIHAPVDANNDMACDICKQPLVSFITRQWDGQQVVENETCAFSPTFITSDTTTWKDGFYVVKGSVTINGRVIVWGNVGLILADGAKLTVTQGILFERGNALTIYGQTEADTGKLEVTGGVANAAGIGGGGTVTIIGGTVTATGGEDGAGIGGGGSAGSGGSVTIIGGTVNAAGGKYGAGIGGGGSGGDGGTVTISGGNVTATGGKYAAGIGGGIVGDGGSVTITGGTVTAAGGEGAVSIGGGKNSTDQGTLNIDKKLGVKAGADADSAVTISKWDFGPSDSREIYMMIGAHEHVDANNDLVCDSCGQSGLTPYIERKWDGSKVVETPKVLDPVTQVTADTTVWSSGFYIVEDTVTVKGHITVNGTAENPTKLILADDAKLTVTQGVRVAGENALIIYGQEKDSGMLEATGDDLAAGIGSGQKSACGSITISGGDVTATGGYYSAGIGNGYDSSGGTVTILGGVVTATGYDNAAGIGGSSAGNGNTVTVYGGTVNANGGYAAAGIGGGSGYREHKNGHGGNVTISGGTVNANGGYYGAGIGGGNDGNGGTVTISGGMVNANGGDGAAGIGGGEDGNGGTVTITGGTVTATGGSSAVSIGGGKNSTDQGTLTIAGKLSVKAGADASKAAAITKRDFGSDDPREHYMKISASDQSGRSSPSGGGGRTASIVTKQPVVKPVTPVEPVVSSKGLPFTDVSTSDWFYNDVFYCYEKGLINGTTETIFGPNLTTSRAMIVMILWRLDGEKHPDYALFFEDVPDGVWYKEAIRWAAAEKIVGGYDEQHFGPDDPITREQLAAILYRYAQYKGIDVSVGEGTNILSYDDAFSISEYAIPAMQWAAGAGLISGTTATTLDPQGSATRAQAAAILHRFCEAK